MAITEGEVKKALRGIARLAQRCDDHAKEWRNDPVMSTAETVRAETYRDAVQQIAEQLGIDLTELWPDLIV